MSDDARLIEEMRSIAMAHAGLYRAQVERERVEREVRLEEAMFMGFPLPLLLAAVAPEREVRLEEEQVADEIEEFYVRGICPPDY